MANEKKKESVDFPVLKHIDEHLAAGGRIEYRQGRVVLIDFAGEYICGGDNLRELLENYIWSFC